jgi:uncharacterized protein (TIGR00266 family)
MDSGNSQLKYEIKGSVHQVAEIHLNAGEKVYSETGGMIWMDANVTMDTGTPASGKGMLGKLGGMLSRAVSGESIFLNYFTAEGGPGRVAFASSFPGSIIDKQLAAGQSIIAQRGAFLVAEESCEIKMEFTKKLGAGLIGGEGFFLQRITGPGVVFLEIDGEVTLLDLEAGQQVKVDTGHIAAFEETVSYDIKLQSLKNMFIGGEGLALATLTGPGRVWLQNQTIPGLAQRLIPFLPNKGS